MEVAGAKRRTPLGLLVTLCVFASAVIVAILTALFNMRHPSTDDASIDADIISVSATVGGRVVQIGAAENQTVFPGQLMFQIDPQPFQLLVGQAQAAVDLAQAELATRQRALFDQHANLRNALEQTRKAVEALGLAQRTEDRLAPLAVLGYVPRQQLDQARSERQTAQANLAQAKVQQEAAAATIDTDAAARASLAERHTALAQARYNLAQTTVRAPRAGRVVGLKVLPGQTVTPDQGLFTLVNDDEWFARANFRETTVERIHAGDCATVFSMLDRRRPIAGVVQGVGAGISDGDGLAPSGVVPTVERQLNWVRVQQRFPVRIRLDHPPAGLMRLGASAVVDIRHGPSCPGG